MTSNTYGAWVVARWINGYPLDDVRPDAMPGHWRELLGVIFSTNGGEREASLRRYFSHRPELDAELMWGFILAADPALEYREDEEEQIYHVSPDVPPLAVECEPTDKQAAAAERAGAWLDEFTKWTDRRADRSPHEFNEAAGVWLAGLAVARRLVLRLGHGDIYPNLYLLGVAPTTLYAKSVSLDCAAEVIDQAVPYLLLPRDVTPESLIDEMAGKLPLGFEDLPALDRDMWEMARKFAAQRGQLMDEASSLFSGFARDYMRGLAEFYLLMYDAARSYYRRTKQAGMAIIHNPCLSFFGMSTPTLFKDAAGNPKHWGSGLWIRFSFLTPTRSPQWTAPRDMPMAPPAVISQHIKTLAETHLPMPEPGKPVTALSVAIEQTAFGAYQRYDKAMIEVLMGKDKPDERLFGTYGRQSTKALKVAITLAALDWSGVGAVTITAGHWFRAQSIVEAWRASTHRLLAWLSRDGTDDEEQRVLHLVGANPDGMTVREVYRRTGKSREDCDVLLSRLVRDGLIEPRSIQPAGGGRPSVKYFLPLGNEHD